MRNYLLSLIIPIVASCGLVGCGTWVTVHERIPAEHTNVVVQKNDVQCDMCYLRYIVKDKNDAKLVSPRAVVERFLKQLRATNLFSKVQGDTGQQLKQGHWRLDVTTKENLDRHTGTNVLKSFLIGFTIFLLSPALPMRCSFESDMNLKLTRWDGKENLFHAKCHATGSCNLAFLGVTNAQIIAESTVRSANWKALIQQLAACLGHENP